MSRFTPTRRNQILAWTGAALAWGTALTTARLEPARARADTSQTGTAAVSETTTPAAMPAQPVGGLVVLRYKPHVEVDPPIRTVYVKKKAPAVTVPAPVQKPTPVPRSRGS